MQAVERARGCPKQMGRRGEQSAVFLVPDLREPSAPNLRPQELFPQHQPHNGGRGAGSVLGAL